MRESLLDIITKIINYIKPLIIKTKDDIRFEGSKSEVIKVMYNSMSEEKIKEVDILFSELNNIKAQKCKLDEQINVILKENEQYSKKIAALKSFQDFLLSNRSF